MGDYTFCEAIFTPQWLGFRFHANMVDTRTMTDI